jgi:hypothetical protein
LGFSFDYVARLGNGNPAKVLYDQEIHKKHVLAVFRDFERMLLKKNPPQVLLGVQPDIAYDRLVTTALWCKNSHFSEEDEYRVIHEVARGGGLRYLKNDPYRTKRASSDALEPLYIERDGSILRFLKLPIAPAGVVRIVLGPRNPARDQPEVLRQFLWDSGYRHLLDKIYLSAGSLR